MSQETEHSHPLEDIFNIDSGSTPVFTEKDPSISVSTDLIDPSTGVPMERKVDNLTADDIAREDRLDDLAVDRQLATIHDAALTAFSQQSRMAQEVDPKFAARNAEVAAQYLNIALNATNSRVDAKYKRGKLRIAANQAGTPQTLNQNVFIADRNAILRQMMEAETQDSPVIEGAIKEVK
jgi:hypothetical protein